MNENFGKPDQSEEVIAEDDGSDMSSHENS